MFESAELGHAVDKARFARQAPRLRAELLEAQLEVVAKKKFAVVVLVGGVDGGGKGETVNLLNEWMDPRHIQTHAMGEPTDEELCRPPFWRYWRAFPPRGKVGIFFGSWYTAPIVDRAFGRIKAAEFDRYLDEIRRVEQMLVNEGALIVKFWMHLTKKNQKARLKALASKKETRWRVTDDDWRNHRNYDTFRRVSERALLHTSTADAPWTVVEATDARYRYLTVAKVLKDAMSARLARRPGAREDGAVALPPAKDLSIDARDVLGALDLTKKLSKRDYERELPKLEARLNELSRSPKFRKIAAAIVFEGPDAAGKGGAIRRVTRALDARQYHVNPTAAPTEEERAQPYLWRFWRHVPRRRHFTIFDRSWYGRVLVERVEGLCTPSDWARAYGEISDFEERLARFGVVVVKFWLAIGKDEQLRRFKEREKTTFKRFKITPEDWRNRKQWGAYDDAVNDMVERTSTAYAPWHLVEANDKYYARIKVLRTLCERIEEAI
jgi:AMP-polyphosphate phosphotransferase